METDDADGGECKKKQGRKMGYFKNYLGTNNGIRVYTDFMKCTFDLRRRVLLIWARTRFSFLRLVGIYLALDNIDDLFKKTMNDEVTT